MKQVSANIPFLISQVNYLIAGMLLCTAGLFAFILLKLGGLVGIGFGYAISIHCLYLKPGYRQSTPYPELFFITN